MDRAIDLLRERGAADRSYWVIKAGSYDHRPPEELFTPHFWAR